MEGGEVLVGDEAEGNCMIDRWGLRGIEGFCTIGMGMGIEVSVRFGMGNLADDLIFNDAWKRGQGYVWVGSGGMG